MNPLSQGLPEVITLATHLPFRSHPCPTDTSLEQASAQEVEGGW